MEEITKDPVKGHTFIDLPDTHYAIQKTEFKRHFISSFIKLSPVRVQSLSCV